ncbi:MAG: MotA/TolQ/ExbB proton channel family protein [Fibrobacteria bacterium]
MIISDSLLRATEQGILGLLLALGAACGFIFIMRWRAVASVRSGATAWRNRLERDLTGDLSADPSPSPSLEAGSARAGSRRAEEAFARGESGSAERLAQVGLKNAHLCPDALEKLLETQEIRERELLERGAQFLGTVGANAPFLGLTGTVLGILSAFRRMAQTGGSGGVEVMSAIAGALIATAAGLIVAIPAVVMYNLLKARVRLSMNALREIRGLLMARSLQSIAKESF